ATAPAFPGVVDEGSALDVKTIVTGDPVRQAVIEASAIPYPELDPIGHLHLLVFGGSQGARIMADVVPAAIERLDLPVRARLRIVQQAREEDLDRVNASYARLGASAEVKSYFADLPARIAAAHLVISRARARHARRRRAARRPRAAGRGNALNPVVIGMISLLPSGSRSAHRPGGPGRSQLARSERQSTPSPRRGEGWGEGDRAIVARVRS